MGPKSLRSLIMCLPRMGQCSTSMDDCFPSRSVARALAGAPRFSQLVPSVLRVPQCEPCVAYTDDPEPPGGGATAGPDQLLSQLHGSAQAAQEAVRTPTELGLGEESGSPSHGVPGFFFSFFATGVRTQKPCPCRGSVLTMSYTPRSRTTNLCMGRFLYPVKSKEAGSR